MSPTDFYSLIGVALFTMGVYSMAVQTDDVRRIVSLNVIGVGVFMVLVAGAQGSEPFADPVPHAMVLTGIVVSVSATAFALALSIAKDDEK